MTASFFALYLVALFYWTQANSFVFEDEGKRKHASSPQYSSAPQTRRLGSHFNPTAFSNILNIPTTLIQATSVAAQSFAPDNADMIDKVFDIPVQTLQAVGSFVQDTSPPSIDRQTFSNRRNERLQRLMKKHQQQQQEQLQSPPPQQTQNEDHASQRHFLGGLGWASVFTDVFFGGRESLFGHDKVFFGEQGVRQGHKKKRKKNKRRLFGGHGQTNNRDDQPIFNNDKDIYQIYNDIHDILPNGLFSWNPARNFDRIQNKIAPGFNDQLH